MCVCGRGDPWCRQLQRPGWLDRSDMFNFVHISQSFTMTLDIQLSSTESSKKSTLAGHT